LQPEVRNDAFDAAGANAQAGLAEFLGDDVGGGVGVEKAVADDLANDLSGAAGATFRTRLAGCQGAGAANSEGLAELEVALFAEVVLGRGLKGAEPQTLRLDDHEELAGDLVVFRDEQRAGGADQKGLLGVELEHGSTGRIGNEGPF
jgi:hypothetical protein